MSVYGDITLNEAAYSILDRLRSHIASTDDIDIREIKLLYNNLRSKYLRQDFNKTARTIDSNYIQDLGCVELEVVSASQLCCNVSGAAMSIDCEVKRTKLEIPATIERYNEGTLTRVGPINRIQVPFSFVFYERAIYSGNGRANDKIMFAFLLNKYIYVIQKRSTLAFQGLKYINIQGVFENPRAAALFQTCEGTTCYTDDSRYPINRWLSDLISDEIVKKLAPSSVAPADETIDSKHQLSSPLREGV